MIELPTLILKKKKFKTPTNYNVDEHYKYSFGIMSLNDNKPQEIILSFNPIQGKYAKSLPLHQTQEILVENDEELRVKLTLYITHDFFMELLSLGNTVRVIQPQSLIEAVKARCTSVLNMYD